jgi:hypothetical protein
MRRVQRRVVATCQKASSSAGTISARAVGFSRSQGVLPAGLSMITAAGGGTVSTIAMIAVLWRCEE